MQDDTTLLKSLLVEFSLQRNTSLEDLQRAETTSLEEVLKTLADVDVRRGGLLPRHHGGDQRAPLRRADEGLGRGLVEEGGKRHGAHQGDAGIRR